MRMLHISALYPPQVVGGAERSTQRLSMSFARDGWQVDVITLVPADGGGLPERSVEDGVTVHRLPLANLYWPYAAVRKKPSRAARLAWHLLDSHNPMMVRRVARLARELAPDVIVTHNLQGFSTALWPALARLGVPVVHVLHDFALLCPRTVLFRDGRNCGHGAARCTDCRLLTVPRFRHARHLTAVVAVSAAVLRIHRDHGLFRELPAAVIHNSAPPGTLPRAAPRERTPGAPFVFGFLGRVDLAKGIETLLEAMRLLEERGLRPELHVAGRADPDYLLTLTARWPLPRVTYLGFVEPVQFLRSLDALVMPSASLEALGNGVWEAYLQGLPVIGSSQGGVPEMIDEGRTGFVFPAGDAAALAERMQRLVDDPAATRAMAAAALAKAPEYLAEVGLGAYDAFLRERIAAAS